jgi:hypothetical protein
LYCASSKQGVVVSIFFPATSTRAFPGFFHNERNDQHARDKATLTETCRGLGYAVTIPYGPGVFFPLRVCRRFDL